MHEAEIASILLNLYTNAIKAIKRSKSHRKILVKADRLVDDDNVRIRFFDSGDGVAAENVDRIFDAFFTTRSSVATGSSDVELATGTGLGLWIVHQIVDNARGEVSVSSPSEGYSTCFEVRLPSESE
jgi:signal transduction histidine kinase